MDNNLNPNTHIDPDDIPDDNQDIDADMEDEYMDEDDGSYFGDDESGGLGGADSQIQQNGRDNINGEAPKKKLSEYFSISAMARNFKEWWGKIPPKTKRFGIVAALVVLAAIILIVIIINTGAMIPAATRLTPEEAGEMMTILQDKKIKYKYDPTLGTISVREPDIGNVAMAFAQEGYPKEGYLFDPVNSSGMFMTDSDKSREAQENLRKLVETSINALEGVSYSLAIITPADNSNSILRSEYKNASAFVTIHMKPGQTLTKKAVNGIETMLLRSVPDIIAENISIQNGRGELLNSDEAAEDTAASDMDMRAFLLDLKKQFESEQEAAIYNKVYELVLPAFGENNFSLAVNLTSDFDAWKEETVIYTGPNISEDTGEMKGITVGEAFDWFAASGADASVMEWGSAGTDTNIDDPAYYDVVADDVEDSAYSGQVNLTKEYLINETRRQLERNTPDIKSATLTLAVNRPVLEDEEEELLLSGMGSATGISVLAMHDAALAEVDYDLDYLRNYITILPMRFYNYSELDVPIPGIFPFGLTPVQLILVSATIVLILILLVIILAMLLKKKKVQREENLEYAEMTELGDLGDLGQAIAPPRRAPEQEEEEELPEPKISLASREAMLKKQITSFTDQNVEIAAQLIKTLLKEDEQNG